MSTALCLSKEKKDIFLFRKGRVLNFDPIFQVWIISHLSETTMAGLGSGVPDLLG